MNVVLSIAARLKNRKTLTNPLLEDLNASSILFGIYGTYQDDNGSFSGIDLLVSERGKFAVSTYTVEESSFTVPTAFEEFENVKSIDLKELATPVKITVNPENVNRKTYIPDLNETRIYIDTKGFDEKILSVEGDLTESGQAYFGEYGSYV